MKRVFPSTENISPANIIFNDILTLFSLHNVSLFYPIVIMVDLNVGSVDVRKFKVKS